MTAKEFVKGAIKYYAQSIVGLFRALFPKTYHTTFPDVLQPGRAAKTLYQRKRENKRPNREPQGAAGVKTCGAGPIPARFNRGQADP